MGKPHIQVYEKFREKYFKLNRRYGKDQYLVPYLISSHRGVPWRTRCSWPSG